MKRISLLSGIEEENDGFLVVAIMQHHGKGTRFLHFPIDLFLDVPVSAQPADIRRDFFAGRFSRHKLVLTEKRGFSPEGENSRDKSL